MPHTFRSRGFTLVEVLLVLTFVALLTTVGVPRFRGMRERSYISSMRSTLRAVRFAEEAYFAEHGQYAVNTESLGIRTTPHVVIALTSTNPAAGWRAVAVHPNAESSCYTGAGEDAPAKAREGILCDGVSGETVGQGS